VEATLLAIIVALTFVTLSPFSAPVGEMSGLSDANAARGGRGSVTVPDGVLGGTVTATVNPGGDGVWAYAACFQGGERVYGQYEKVDATNQVVFRLGPTPSWTSGDADCVAQEGSWTKGGKWRVVAEATFQATDPH
jgi:hypothetical protein